jgi:hypothetical protein
MAVLDLRTAARALSTSDGMRLEAPSLSRLSQAERRAAIATWLGRMVNEHVSAQVFAGLIPQLMRAEISGERQAQVAEMIADEMRHARQCAAVVDALGGEAIGELPEIVPVPTHDDASPLEALLRNVLSICCMSETVAVALIGAERLESGPAPLRATLTTILADEVQHARFGWTLLEEVRPRLDDVLRARLSRWLVAAFAHLKEHELAHLPAGGAPSKAASEVGVCDGMAARALFFDTVERVIVPGLEGHGFAARAAWAEVRAGTTKGRRRTETSRRAVAGRRRS